MHHRRLSCIGLLLLLAAPIAWAAPTVVPTSTATEFVAAGDTILFATQTQFSTGSYLIIAPDGAEVRFIRNPIAGTGAAGQLWDLATGTQLSGNAAWTMTGNFNGVPADGTWTIQSQATSSTNGVVISERPAVLLTIQGKTLEFGVNSETNPSYNNPQLWNWHIAGTTEVENGGNVPMAPTSETTLAAYEDPNNAKYFTENTPGANQPPESITNGFTITCGSFTATMTVNGAWIDSSTTTVFSRFIYRDGNFLGTPDLETIPLSSTTTPENEGITASGVDAKTIPYNNGAGTSYQFSASNTYGSSRGIVFYAAAGQCDFQTFPTTANTEHSSDALEVTSSHAQCRDDATTWSVIMMDNPSGLQEHLLQLYILDANQGGLGSPPDPITVLYFNTTTMHRTAASSEAHSHYIADVLAPGNYVAYAYVDYTGVGAVDYVDAEAFSVPAGACGETAITEILNLFNTTLNNVDFLNQTIHEHRNGTIEISTMNDFNGLGFDGFLFMLGWLFLLLWSLWNAKLVIAGVASAGFGSSLFIAGTPDFALAGQLVSIALLPVAIWLEAILKERIYSRFIEKTDRRET